MYTGQRVGRQEEEPCPHLEHRPAASRSARGAVMAAPGALGQELDSELEGQVQNPGKFLVLLGKGLGTAKTGTGKVGGSVWEMVQ